MAVRKFILNIGQSNAGAHASYADWGLLHAGLYVDFPSFAWSSNAAKGYSDTLTIPGVWPEFPTVSLKGSAVDAIRYLTLYNPTATGLAYLSYPHTMRITQVTGHTTSATALKTSLKWQYDPEGQTFTRKRTGTVHTVPAASWGGLVGAAQQDEFICTPAFDPPAEVGEELTYAVRAGAASPTTSTIVFDSRFGDDYGTDGSWDGSLAGMRVRCTASGHPGNVGQVRYVSDITLDAAVANDIAGGPVPTVKMTFSEAWPNHPNAGDVFVIKPPPVGAVTVPFEKWGYFLPWCPIEGRTILSTITASAVASAAAGAQSQFTVPSDHGVVVGSYVNVKGQSQYQGNWLVTAVGATTITLGIAYSVVLATTTYLRPMGKVNPYPPGFNYPNHVDKPVLFQPFVGETYMYGPSAFALSARAAYHVGLANRIQEKLGEAIYVVSLAVDGSTIAQTDLYTGGDTAVGWYDPHQQTSWAPGDRNNCFARLVDTLDAARLAALRDGDTLECVGIFMVQGEGDAAAGASAFAQRYADNLRSLKSSVRTAIVSAGLYSGVAATIPWVQPLISAANMATPWPYATTVNQAIQLNAAEDVYMRTVQMDDAPKIVTDDAHYDASGITLLEYRAFELWEQIRESIDPAGYASDLAVETGTSTGSATSNSYATIDYVTAYFANIGGVTAWTNATPQARSYAMMRATSWIDSNYGLRFVGLRATSTQALEWPRSFAYDRTGYELSGVPLAMQKATAEIARRFLEDSTQFDADTPAASNVLEDSLSVGPISISKTYAGTKDAAKRFPIVDRLLNVAGIIESGGWANR